jgi:hypothetical protein
MDVDRYDALTHEQRIDLLAEVERDQARVDARRTVLLAAIDRGAPNVSIPGHGDKDWIGEEVAYVLRISSTSARRRITEAATTVALPGVLDAVQDGTLPGFYARALARGVQELDKASAVAVSERVMARADSTSYPSFCKAVQRAVLALAPEPDEMTRARALAERRVTFRPYDVGTTGMFAVLPDEDAAAIRDILHHAARTPTRPDDARTLTQREADSLTELMLTAAAVPEDGPVGRRPLIQVSVALSTLLGMDQEPGELAGVGPIPAQLARRLADDPSGTWRRMVTDEKGELVDYGRTTYQPPAALGDHIVKRDRACTFPTCDRTAERCEIDHRIPWAAGGETNAGNLHCLCPRHHHLKDETTWAVQRTADGSTIWTSPTGKDYPKPPPEPYPIDGTFDQSYPSPDESDDPEPPHRPAPPAQPPPEPPPPF